MNCAMFNEDAMTNISPIDGRYAAKAAPLREEFSAAKAAKDAKGF